MNNSQSLTNEQMMENEIGSIEWLKKQIREFQDEYENQSDQERCMFIDGKLTILKLWLNEKTIPKEVNPEIKNCYEKGYDSIINGANKTNCNFALFRSSSYKDAWEEGRKDAGNGNPNKFANRDNGVKNG